MLIGIVSIVLSSRTLRRMGDQTSLVSLSAIATVLMLITSIIAVALGSVSVSLDVCNSGYYYDVLDAACAFGAGAIISWIAWAFWAASIVPASIILSRDKMNTSRTV